MSHYKAQCPVILVFSVLERRASHQNENSIMNRRQANKLLSLVFTAPFAAPALAGSQLLPIKPVSASSFILQKSTWADKGYQSLVSSFTHLNLFNAGMPESNAYIGFPLTHRFDPQFQLNISAHGIGLGSEYAKEIFGDFDPMALMNDLSSQMELDPQQQAAMLENAKQLQEAFESMTKTGFVVTAAGVAAGAAVAGAAIAYGGLLLTAFSIGYKIGKDKRASEDDDGDGAPNGKDKFPNDPDKSFKAMDANNNGIPDDLEDGEFGTLYTFMRDALDSAYYFPEDSEAFIAFSAEGDALRVDTSLTIEGETSAVRINVEA